MSRGFASSYRIILLATGMLACFAGLAARLYWLHVIDREDWLSSIGKVRRQLIVEPARRGNIVDARGAVLATSHSSIVLGVDPSALVETEREKQKWPRLAALIGLPEAELRRIFTTKFRAPAPASAPAAPAAGSAGLVFNFDLSKPSPAVPAASPGTTDDDDTEVETGDSGQREIKWVKLRENVSEQLYTEIKALGLKGITGDRVYRRKYPNDQLAAHLIGYVDREGQPVAGIEYYTDFYLRGQNGWRVGERDGRRRELAQFNTREVPRADGYSVMLSIDSMVQDVIEQELRYLAERFEPKKATIIVSDPRTGFILGMANYPTFNLNEYRKVPKAEEDRMRNVAVADVYEPGSVFKIVAAAGALEERLVNRDTVFDCSIETREYTNPKNGRTLVLKLPREDHRFTHPLTVAEIIAHSSNKGAAQLGMLLGEERLNRYARAFGFGRSLGFPVGGEVRGIFRPVEKWDPLDITRIPMGHTISATVLQMHQAMAVIASGGVLYRPQVILQIRDAAEEVVYRYNRVELGRVVSEATARAMAGMLMGVASKEGTAPEAAIEGYDVAGKTGTTQKLEEVILPSGKKTLEYSTKHHVASFVGFFPATARPGERQVAISVIVDDADAKAPGGAAYGKSVAAPSFRKIGEKLIPILDIKPAGSAARSPLIAANEGGRR